MSNGRTTRLVLIGLSIIAVAICGLAAAAVFFLNERSADSATAVSTPTVVGVDTIPQTGLLIIHVLPDSPAAEAGLTWGQFILAVDETPVAETAAFTAAIAEKGADGVVRLTVAQGSSQRTLPITLAADPPLLGVQVVAAGGLDLPLPLGDESANLPATWPQVTAVAPDSPAALAELAVGDVITAVDAEAVLTADELVAAIQARAPETTVTLTLRRGPDTLERTVTLAPHPDDAARPYLGINLDS